MSRPLLPVTYVSAVRNCVRWIDACAESVLHQNGGTCPWVVVDNASDDGTRDRLATWAARDARVLVIAADTNWGAAKGTSLALERVNSPFTAILDGDDVAMPSRTVVSLRRIDTVPRAIATYGDAEFCDADDKPLPHWFTARDASAVRRLAEFTMPVIHSTGMFVTDWLRREVPRFPIAPAHDYFLLGRALEEGEVAFASECLVRYRVHGNSMSQSRPVPQFATGAAVSISASLRRVGRPDDLIELLPWADAVGTSARDHASVHVQTALKAWEKRLPRLTVYHARRAIRRGRLRPGTVLVKALATGGLSSNGLFRLLRGGLLGAARVDGQGYSVP